MYTKRSHNLSETNTGRFQIVYPTYLKQLENAMDVYVTYQTLCMVVAMLRHQHNLIDLTWHMLRKNRNRRHTRNQRRKRSWGERVDWNTAEIRHL